MRIGIFGGSFNPPHSYHEEIANHLIIERILDKVIFVPTGNHYAYKDNLLSDKDRLNMLKLITKNNTSLSCDDYELKDYPVYTYETLKHFKELNPNDEICFICGTDNLTYMDRWEKGIDILKEYKILVFKRQTDDIDEILKRLEKYRNNIYVIDFKENNLSSTFIRENINNELIKEFLHNDVYNYIINNNLYR